MLSKISDTFNYLGDKSFLVKAKEAVFYLDLVAFKNSNFIRKPDFSF